MAEQKFPSEMIDLPSGGKVYVKDSPMSTGKLEIKYMTAREEDILTSQNLIKKGVVIDRLLDSLILTEGVKTDDLVLGDKNAIMVAARILAYGPEYECEVTNPNTGNTFSHIFNLAECPFKKISSDIESNSFDVELPVSKSKINFKLLTGVDEKNIEVEVKSMKKLGSQVSKDLTTRLKYSIVSFDGETDINKIGNLVQNMLSRDSLFLRNKINEVSPDIELKQEIEIGGDVVEVDIPLTINFFWPDS
tara:strand:+ start:35 stop:778 length:744 start_codon:yes stop_codon:yes gene_type:complete